MIIQIQKEYRSAFRTEKFDNRKLYYSVLSDDLIRNKTELNSFIQELKSIYETEHASGDPIIIAVFTKDMEVDTPEI